MSNRSLATTYYVRWGETGYSEVVLVAATGTQWLVAMPETAPGTRVPDVAVKVQVGAASSPGTVSVTYRTLELGAQNMIVYSALRPGFQLTHSFAWPAEVAKRWSLRELKRAYSAHGGDLTDAEPDDVAADREFADEDAAQIDGAAVGGGSAPVPGAPVPEMIQFFDAMAQRMAAMEAAMIQRETAAEPAALPAALPGGAMASMRPALFGESPAGAAGMAGAREVAGMPPLRPEPRPKATAAPPLAQPPQTAPAPSLESLLVQLLASRVSRTDEGKSDDEDDAPRARGLAALDVLERRNAADPGARVRAFERTLQEKYEGRSPSRYMQECTDLPYNRLLGMLYHLTAMSYAASKYDTLKCQNLLVSTMLFLEQAGLDGGRTQFAYHLTLAPEMPPAPDASSKPKRDKSGRAAFAKLAERQVISSSLAAVKDWSRLSEIRSKLD